MKNFVRVNADQKTVSFSSGQQNLYQIPASTKTISFFHTVKKQCRSPLEYENYQDLPGGQQIMSDAQ